MHGEAGAARAVINANIAAKNWLIKYGKYKYF